MAWTDLIAIKDEAKAMRRADREKPIVECPRCGEPLQVRGEVYNCPWGHFTQRGAHRSAESY